MEKYYIFHNLNNKISEIIYNFFYFDRTPFNIPTIHTRANYLGANPKKEKNKESKTNCFLVQVFENILVFTYSIYTECKYKCE